MPWSTFFGVSMSSIACVRASQSILSSFAAMRGGVVLEMGGLDGNISSQSRVLENVDWKRIIVEGNPQFREGLSKLSTAVTVNAVVCEKTQSGGSRDEVHFVADGRDMFVSGEVMSVSMGIARHQFSATIAGVLEHMTTKFVRRRFPLIYNALAGSPKSLRQSHGESKVFNASAVNWQHPSLQLLLSPHETSRKEGLFSVTPCSFWMWKALRSQFFGPLISRKPPLMSW